MLFYLFKGDFRAHFALEIIKVYDPGEKKKKKKECYQESVSFLKMISKLWKTSLKGSFSIPSQGLNFYFCS